MRKLLPLLLAFVLSPAHAAEYSPGAIRLAGQDYVPLADWARANALGWRWVSRDRTLEVTNRSTQLRLDADSAQAEVNGVRVRLSFPFAVVKSRPFLAQLDLDATIRPLLFPPRLAVPRPIRVICLDPGHGGRDSGNRVWWHEEKRYTLPLALDLRDQLRKAGFSVVLTRSTDTYVKLADRPALANRLKADLFLSLHFNATVAGRDEVEGPETYCITPVGASSSNERIENSEYGSTVGTGPTVANRDEQQSLLLAYQVQKALVRNLEANDRGVKRARFAVLRDATMPAILIEGGFMTHPAEGKRIYNATYRHEMAEAIVRGILAYQQAAARGTPQLSRGR